MRVILVINIVFIMMSFMVALSAYSTTNNLDDFATKLWSDGTESEIQLLYQKLEVLPVDDYIPLLLEMYKTPSYQDTEASPYLAAVVYHYYLKKCDGEKAGMTLLDLIKKKDVPVNLKRDLIRDIPTWSKDVPFHYVIKSLDELGAQKDEYMFLLGQYGLAKYLKYVLRSRPKEQSATKEQIAALMDKNIEHLVTSYNSKSKESWSAKTLCNYRKMLGDSFDKKLVVTLKNSQFSNSKKTSIIKQICGWEASGSEASGSGINNKLYESGQSKTNRITEAKQERIKSIK